jgi:hypothetical protein
MPISSGRISNRASDGSELIYTINREVLKGIALVKKVHDRKSGRNGTKMPKNSLVIKTNLKDLPDFIEELKAKWGKWIAMRVPFETPLSHLRD